MLAISVLAFFLGFSIFETLNNPAQLFISENVKDIFHKLNWKLILRYSAFN